MKNSQKGFVILLLIIIAVALIVDGVIYYHNLNNNNTKSSVMVGGDRDSHGCIGSAGYSWDESTQQCSRPWEHSTSTPGVK